MNGTDYQFMYGQYNTGSNAIRFFNRKKPVYVVSYEYGDIGIISNDIVLYEQEEIARLFAASPQLLNACNVALLHLKPQTKAYQIIKAAIKMTER